MDDEAEVCLCLCTKTVSLHRSSHTTLSLASMATQRRALDSFLLTSQTSPREASAKATKSANSTHLFGSPELTTFTRCSPSHTFLGRIASAQAFPTSSVSAVGPQVPQSTLPE